MNQLGPGEDSDQNPEYYPEFDDDPPVKGDFDDIRVTVIWAWVISREPRLPPPLDLSEVLRRRGYAVYASAAAGSAV